MSFQGNSLGIDDLSKQGGVYPDNSQFTQPTAATNLNVPFWSDSPSTWDSVVIAGFTLPGVCTVNGRVSRRVDKKSAPGTNGQTVTYVGDDVAEFDITVRMWTSDHLTTFINLLTFLKDQKSPDDAAGLAIASGSSSKLTVKVNSDRGYSKFPMAPVSVTHPTLTMYRVRAAHVLEYGFPRPVGDAAAGIYEVTIKMIEHITLNKGQVSTPKAAIDATIVSKGPGAIPPKIKSPATVNITNPTAATDYFGGAPQNYVVAP